MTEIAGRMRAMARQAKSAATVLRALGSGTKNAVLRELAALLQEKQAQIQQENALDLEAGARKGLSQAMLARLELSDRVMAEMVQGLHEVADMADPLGEIGDMQRRPSGILVGRMRVPLGVILMIYESRPNVTIDSAALCLKSGNAVILRGGSEALRSNLALAAVFHEALSRHQLDPDLVQVVPTTERSAIDALLEQEDCIDLVIPRGNYQIGRASCRERV